MALLRRFVAGVKKIPGVALYGDFDHERTAVAALNIGDMDSGEVSDILSEDYGIATRPGAHCAPRCTRRSARRSRARCASASAGTIRKRKRTPRSPRSARSHMREKKLWLVITFHTTAAAIAMEKLCRAKGLPGRLIPVPRELTADCGMSWRAEVQDRAALAALTEAEGLEVDGFYELMI